MSGEHIKPKIGSISDDQDLQAALEAAEKSAMEAGNTAQALFKDQERERSRRILNSAVTGMLNIGLDSEEDQPTTRELFQKAFEHSARESTKLEQSYRQGILSFVFERAVQAKDPDKRERAIKIFERLRDADPESASEALNWVYPFGGSTTATVEDMVTAAAGLTVPELHKT